MIKLVINNKLIKKELCQIIGKLVAQQGFNQTTNLNKTLVSCKKKKNYSTKKGFSGASGGRATNVIQLLDHALGRPDGALMVGVGLVTRGLRCASTPPAYSLITADAVTF